MKINITLALEKNELPLDWRRQMLSLIKSVLEKEAPDVYNKFYSKGNTSMKPFTFWTLLSNPKFTNDVIILDNAKFNLFISTTDTKLAFCLYNGMKQFKGKFNLKNDNNLTVEKVKLEDEKEIIEHEILINMLSPLVVRQHYVDEKDRYILHNEDGFIETFEKCVMAQIKNSDKIPEIVPIKCKKVIVKAYGTNIPATLGIFKLTGDIKTLNKLYKEGIASKTSAGFGKFEVIG